MRVREIIDEDFVNYKKPSMFIGTISCGGKCCTEAGIPASVCQNYELRKSRIVNMPNISLCKRYFNNDITSAIVFGGLEPFEQADELLEFIQIIRRAYWCNDDIVIYTGYNPEEIEDYISSLKKYPNIIIKYGRYIPNKPGRYDDVLGVNLASDNQYAERIS